jgi:hypothetical protein
MPTNARDYPLVAVLSGTEKIFLSDGLTADAGNNAYANTIATFCNLNNVMAAANIGVSGVGVWDNKTSHTLNFRNISAGSPLINVSLDDPNNLVVINAIQANFTLNSIGGTLGIAKGGSGQTTANAAFNAFAPSQTTHAGKYLTTDGTNTSWAPVTTGTVTSVALTMPSIFSVAGSPITTSGTFSVTFATQTANTVFAGPTSGIPATPTFRTLDPLDVPNLDTSKITSGTFPIARGGTNTGATPTNGQLLIGNGTDYTLATLTAGSSKLSVVNGVGSITLDVVPANIDKNTLGGSALSPANGGTGAIATPTNGQLLIGNGTTYTVANLTAGTYTKITNASGSITVDSTLNTKDVVDLGIAFLTTTTIQLQTGKARNSTDLTDIILGSNQTINFSVNGAVNRLDAGTIAAATWYHVFVIASADGTTLVGGLASLSQTAPTLPGGYTIFRRVASVRTAPGSAVILDVQQSTYGRFRKYRWRDTVANLTVLTNGASTTFSALSLAGCMSPNATVALLSAIFTPQVASDSFYFRNTGSAVSIANSINRYSRGAASGAPAYRLMCEILTNTSQSVDYAVDDASDTLTLVGYGYEEVI